MNKEEIYVAEWLDKFDESNFTLIFMESAIRSMIQDGNINELYVTEGVSSVLCSLVEDYQQLSKTVKSFFQSLTITTMPTTKDSVDKDGKDEKT